MPIFILLSMFFYEKTYSQNPIGTSLHPIVGDLYHTGGNIGIGTQSPKELLHIFSSSGIPAIRLENYNAKKHSVWNIQNNTSFILNYTFDGIYNTKFILTPSGQLVLGTELPDACAIMQLESTDKGLLIPHMTTIQKNAISSPANGLLVYDTDLKAFSYYDISSGTWLNTAISSELSDYLLINDFNNTVAGGITQSDTANWNTAYNYSQNFTESDPIFTAWDKDYNELTNKPDLFEGNWENLSGTVPNISIFANDVGYITEAGINSLWQEDENGNIYRENGNVGIGINNPYKQLELFNNNTNTSCIRLSIYNELKKSEDGGYQVWDIENSSSLKFKYFGADNFVTDPPETVTKFKFSSNGTLTASKFVGDGSGLTNVSGSWQQNGNKLYYNSDNVGIGTDNPMSHLEINKSSGGSWNTPFIKIKRPYDSDLAAIGIETNQQNWVIAAINSSTGNEGFWIKNIKTDNVPFRIKNNGVVVVNGNLWVTNEVAVQASEPWPDYVFKKDYRLMPLEQLQKFIYKNNRLPDMPSSEDIKKEGIKLAENQTLMLQKIEELTLYIIQLNEENSKLQKRIKKLENN